MWGLQEPTYFRLWESWLSKFQRVEKFPFWLSHCRITKLNNFLSISTDIRLCEDFWWKNSSLQVHFNEKDILTCLLFSWEASFTSWSFQCLVNTKYSFCIKMCDSIRLPLFHISLQKSSGFIFISFMIRANKILNRSDPEKPLEKKKYRPTTPDFVPEHQNQNLIHSVDGLIG